MSNIHLCWWFYAEWVTNISQQYVKAFFFSILWSVSNKSRFDCTTIIHNSTQNGHYQHCAASTCTTNWSIIFWNANINHWPNFGCDHHFYYWFRSIYTRRLDCRKNEFRFVENCPFGNACTQNKSILWTFCHTAFIYFQNKKDLISLFSIYAKHIKFKFNVCIFHFILFDSIHKMNMMIGLIFRLKCLPLCRI